MALITANDIAVLSCTVELPKIGIWSADLVLDQPDGTGFDVGTQVTVTSDEGIKLKGTVVPDRTGSFLQSVHVRIQAGAAGMGDDVEGQSFIQPGARANDVLKAIADAAGETLSSDIDPAFLQKNLTAWTIFKGPASHALETFLGLIAPTFTWRMLEDGKLWVGEESWPDNSDGYDLIDSNPSQGYFELGVVSPTFLPGQNIPEGDQGPVGHINRVTHVLTADKTRSLIWIDVDQERGFAGAVAEIVDQRISGIDYFTKYAAKVVSQSADGATLDLQPEDERLGKGLQRVPLDHGLPGMTVKVTPGGFIGLGWRGGNPQFPYASIWQNGTTVIELDLDATIIKLAGGGAGAVRVGDAVTGTAGPYPLSNAQVPVGSLKVQIG